MASSGSSGSSIPVPDCGCCHDCQQGGESPSDAKGGADPSTGAATGGGGGGMPSLGQNMQLPGGGGGGGGMGGFPGGPGGGGGGFGMGLGERRVYGNLQDGNGNFGANWSDPSLPRLAFSGNDVIVERGGRQNLAFRANGSGYTADYFIRDVLTQDGGTGEFTLTDTDGGQQVFDSTGVLQEAKDALGHAALYSYNSTTKLLESVEVDDGGSKSVKYTYSHDGSDRVDRVTLSVDGTDLRRITYTYYSGNDNIEKAVLESYNGTSWDELETSYYAYHGASNDGLLKYVLGPDAYHRYSGVSGADLEDYADYEYAYYGASDPDGEEGQVKTVWTAGRTYEYGFVYAASPYSGGDTNTWVGKTEVTQPDGETKHVYFYNSGRQMMFKMVEWPSGTTPPHRQAVVYQEFDPDGRAVLRAEPSAIDMSAFDPENTQWVVDLKTDEGLVHVSEYYDGLSPSDQPAGYLHYTAVREGSGGSDVKLKEYTYEEQIVGGLTLQRQKTVKVYREATDTAASDPATTSYAYTYHQSGGSDTFQIKKKTTSLPAVIGDENGDGQTYTTEHHYDGYGFLEKYVDELGTVTEYEYDLSSGGLTKATRDADGTPLVSDMECDGLGRNTLVKGPAHEVSLSGTATDIRRTVWTQYLDADDEVRTIRGYINLDSTPNPTEHTVDPVQISVHYAAAPLNGNPPDPDLTGYSMTEEIAAVYGGSGVPPETHSFAQSSYRSLRQVISNKGGRRVRERVYHDIPSTGPGDVDTNYAETLLSYDSNGRRDKVTEPEGTIRKTLFDRLGRPEEQKVGTDDSGGAGENMVRVSTSVYDLDGNVTQRTLYPRGGSASTYDRVTDYTYDWRGRNTRQEWDDGWVDSTGAKQTRTLILSNTYDNRDNVKETVEYEGSVADANRINLAETSFDARNRVYRTKRYGIDGSTVDAALVSERYYDGKGNLLRDKPAGKVGYTVTLYDALSRPDKVYRAFGGVAASSSGGTIDPDDISSSTVMEQAEFTYDAGGNRTRTVTRLRFDDASGTGPLGDPSSTTQPKARVMYSGSYPDPLGRDQASVEVGTNPQSGTPTAWTPPPAVPTRSEDVLVTSYSYDDAGRLEDTTDAAGTVTRREYDDAGRLTKQIENYDPPVGSSSSGADQDANVTTRYEYNSDGNMTKLVAENPSTGNQETVWEYGVDQAGGTAPLPPAVSRNDLVAKKVYPDGSTSTTDNVTYAYNVLGEVVEMEDQNETSHGYDYDRVGRLRADRVTLATVTAIDGAVLRIDRTYEARGMLELVTSFDAASGGSEVNQVKLTYNNYSQLESDEQEHSGEVDGNTKKVAYDYASGAANTVRRTKVAYPSDAGSGWSYNYHYATAGDGADDELSRVSAVRSGSGASQLVSYRYLGLGTFVGVEYDAANGTEMTYETGSNGDAGDKYTGLDRFGRLVETIWEDSSAEKLHSSYGRNTFGGVVWRRDDLAHNQNPNVKTEDQYYWYDGLYRVEERQRGELDGTAPNFIGIKSGTVQQDEDFVYDATGNWLNYDRLSPSNAQTRSHNKANEITEIQTEIGGSPNTIDLDPGGYDAAGNMLKLPADPVGETTLYDLTWDAWNRLVKIENGAMVLGDYAYDGLNRRVSLAVGGNTRHFYYNDQWRAVEEYVFDGTETNLEREYCWGAQDRWDLVRRRRDTGTSIDDEERYVLRDYLDPYATIDDSGVVKQRFGYDAFGRHRFLDPDWSAGVNLDDWTWLFHGEFIDLNTGVYNYGYRYYAPHIGRWASRDPLGERVGVNPYQFVGNSPIDKLDLYGLEETKDTGCTEGDHRTTQIQIKFIDGNGNDITNTTGDLPGELGKELGETLAEKASSATKALAERFKETFSMSKIAQMATSTGAPGTFGATLHITFECCVCIEENEQKKYVWEEHDPDHEEPVTHANRTEIGVGGPSRFNVGERRMPLEFADSMLQAYKRAVKEMSKKCKSGS